MSTSQSPCRAFVAFAGGGAKGLVHVGALRALEDEGVQICGASGTSAGAIVAALCAAGLKGEDLVSADGSRTLFSELAEIDPRFQGATALFGPGGWSRIAFFREVLQDLDLSRLVGGGLLWVLGGLAFAASSPDWSIAILEWIAGSLLLALAVAVWIVIGLADLAQFRTALAELLRRRLGLPAGETVTFGHFGDGRRPSLKIVASDLTGRKMRLFSPQLTRDTPVADAVAASICLPFIFRPWQVDGRRFVDGGLVSNLPAWPFDEERELDLDALTIAFDIRGPTPKEKVGAVTWLGAAVETALSGAGELNTRAVQRGYLFELKSNLDLLAFDMRPADVRAQVEESTAAARVAIRKQIFTDPDIYRDACATMQRSLLTAFKTEADLFESGKVGTVRVVLAVPEPGYFSSLRLKYGAGNARHLDRNMLIPRQGSLEGEAFVTGDVLFDVAPFAPEAWLPGDRYRGLRERVWSRLKWTLVVPISNAERDATAFVVSVNGSGDFRDTPRLEPFLSELVSTIEDFFREVVVELNSQD